MRIRLQPADMGGCGYYRLRWPAVALKAMGVDINVPDVWPTAICSKTDYWDQVERVEVDCDVMVFQRPMERKLLESFPALRRQGVTIVVELDDDFHALPKGHPAKRDTAPMHHEEINRRWLRLMCQEADLVTCTTQAIADRYAPHGRVRIVPNFVPAWYLDVEKVERDGPVRVGWTGSTQTHINDLRVCGTGVADALKATGADFHVVGTGVGVAEQLRLDPDQVTASGWMDIESYPHEYAQLDVAIVPLQPNPFNEAKSYLKGLEAAAVGVPFVASPTGPYNELCLMGAGYVADDPEAWNRKVTDLVTRPIWRDQIREAGRAFAATQTIEGNCWRWLEAWEQARTNAQARKQIAA